MKKKFELRAHPFIGETLKQVAPIFAIQAEYIKQYEEKHNTWPSKGDHQKIMEFVDSDVYYHYHVFMKLGNLLQTVDLLETSLKFVKHFPHPRTYEKQKITQYNWLVYHYCFFTITYVSILDIALILTNSVFRLGMSEKDCKPDIIMKNDWIANSKTKTALKALQDLVSRHREPRNLSVHRGRSPNIANIINSEYLDLLRFYSIDLENSKKLIDAEAVDFLFQRDANKIHDKLHKDFVLLEEVLQKIFDSYVPVYKRKTKEFEHKK